MTTFNEREQAFEAKFAHDEEFRFLVDARRDKLFAHWAASVAGIAGEAETALVDAVLAIPNGPDHDATAMRHARRVLAERGVAVTDPHLVAALDRCAIDARGQLTAHPPHQSDIV